MPEWYNFKKDGSIEKVGLYDNGKRYEKVEVEGGEDRNI